MTANAPASPPEAGPSAADSRTVMLEVYRQAHETRRRWEGYIWQYSLILTVLAAFLAQNALLAPSFTVVQRIILSLLALFVIAIFANVLRARSLMKKVEKTISQLHADLGANYRVVPLELNESLPWYERISSTKIAVICHLIACIVFVGLAAYAWLH